MRCYYKDTVSMFIYKLTAILIIIDARYHDFNSFPVVNWYWKPLKADNGRQLLWDWQYWIVTFQDTCILINKLVWKWVCVFKKGHKMTQRCHFCTRWQLCRCVFLLNSQWHFYIEYSGDVCVFLIINVTPGEEVTTLQMCVFLNNQCHFWLRGDNSLQMFVFVKQSMTLHVHVHVNLF